MEQNQANFEGWAIVEIMGRQQYTGFVKTEAYGQATLFRIDVPEVPECESTLKGGGYDKEGTWLPPGSKVVAEKVQGYTKLVGASSIYAITPCTEQAAMEAVRQTQRQPLRLVELPANGKAIAAPTVPDYAEDDDPDERF